MKTRVLGIIPARFASTRLPAKLMIPIQGKTLIQRTFEAAKQAPVLDELIVATDDHRIFEHVESFGGRALMTSVECSNGTDRIAEVLNKHPDMQNAAAVVNIQGDHPCFDPQDIEAAVALLLSDPQAQMATLATPLRSEEDALSSSVVKCVIDKHHNALYFSRALIPSNKKHSFNPQGTYLQHIGLYVYRPQFVLEYQKLSPTPLQLEEDLEQLKVLEHGYRIKVAMTDKISLGVDTAQDLIKVEQWLCQQNTYS